jgi:hypothetical protein
MLTTYLLAVALNVNQNPFQVNKYMHRVALDPTLETLRIHFYMSRQINRQEVLQQITVFQ